MKELIIAFDVRICEPFPNQEWPQERISKYLLKSKIRQPLSTDELVWRRPLDRSIQFLSLFSSETSLNIEETFNTIGDNEWLIAITLIKLDKDPLPSSLVPSVTMYPPANYVFLGYDISDEALLSGLMNCGYNGDFIDKNEKFYGKSLNSYHLFEDLDTANQFLQLTDHRVPEHAPFNIFGIYRIRSHNSEDTPPLLTA